MLLEAFRISEIVVPVKRPGGTFRDQIRSGRVPEGRFETSPGLQAWVSVGPLYIKVPEGRPKNRPIQSALCKSVFGRPSGTLTYYYSTLSSQD